MGAAPRARTSGLLAASRPAYNLLAVPGVVVTAGDARWLGGLRAEPDACDVPLAFADASEGGWPYWWQCPAATGTDAAAALDAATGGIKEIDLGRALVEVDPITIWAGETCTGLDLGSPERSDELAAKVRRKLNAVLPAAVEHELWTGQVASRADFPNHWLQETPGTQINGGGTTGFVTALAELEQALADNGPLQGQRIIHAQPRVVTVWRSRGLVEPSPDRQYLVTALGTYVVPGNGYTGGAPGGPGDESSTGSMSTSWAYGTGPVRVLLDQPVVQMPDGTTVDRTDNDVELRAEINVAIVWDPCVKVAARVGLCDEYCGSGS